MYALLGLPRLLGVYASLAGVVTVIVLLFDLAYMSRVPAAYPGWFSETWGAASKGMSAAAFLFGLGQTPVFPWACRLPLIRHILPDISGRWVGGTESNWPQISARIKADNQAAPPETQITPVSVTIKARLLSVGMTLESDTRYSNSETIAVSVLKHGAKDGVRLAYIYENYTPHPEPTDSGHHYGAACVDLFVRNGHQSLEGNYWTNRNWEKGLNTAGRIILRRET
jgi:hypothetical protein